MSFAATLLIGTERSITVSLRITPICQAGSRRTSILRSRSRRSLSRKQEPISTVSMPSIQHYFLLSAHDLKKLRRRKSCVSSSISSTTEARKITTMTQAVTRSVGTASRMPLHPNPLSSEATFSRWTDATAEFCICVTMPILSRIALWQS